MVTVTAAVPGELSGALEPALRMGVAGLGVAFGERHEVAAVAADYVDDPARVLRWGYHSFHVAAAGQTSTDLAVRAAAAALDDAGVSAADVDLIVLADSDVPEYLHWDASAALARALKVHGTPTLLLSQACASGVTGFATVAGSMAVRSDVRTVLFVAVNRVSDAFRNRMSTSTSLGSDGAAAAVLRRGHERLRWLATEQHTEPEYCDLYRSEYGGASTPVAPHGGSNADVTVLMRVQEHFDRDPARVVGFVDALTDGVGAIVRKACASAGVDTSALGRLIYLNDNVQSLRAVADAVGVRPERTNIELAAELGHLGGADQLSCLHEHLRRGEIDDGELIAMAGVSGGMHWFCTLLRA